MSKDGPLSDYHAYLLRCWRDPTNHADGLAGWRFSIEDPGTGSRQGFATWTALADFIHTELCKGLHIGGTTTGMEMESTDSGTDRS